MASIGFLASVLKQIKNGKLREEYALVWMLSTTVLIVLSFWRNGLNVIGNLFGVYAPLNLIFAGAIMAGMIYLLHLSMTVSRLHDQNKALAQELVLLKQKFERSERE